MLPSPPPPSPPPIQMPSTWPLPPARRRLLLSHTWLPTVLSPISHHLTILLLLGTRTPLATLRHVHTRALECYMRTPPRQPAPSPPKKKNKLQSPQMLVSDSIRKYGREGCVRREKQCHRVKASNKLARDPQTSTSHLGTTVEEYDGDLATDDDRARDGALPTTKAEVCCGRLEPASTVAPKRAIAEAFIVFKTPGAVRTLWLTF